MAVITVLGVLVVLVLLLRAIVAPIYLVLTVLLSYLAHDRAHLVAVPVGASASRA